MLFKFGLPADINRHGRSYLVLEQDDEAEKATAGRYEQLGRAGMGLVVLAFFLQLLATLLAG